MMDRCCDNCVHGDMDNSCSRTFSKDEKNLAYGIKLNRKGNLCWCSYWEMADYEDGQYKS